MISLGHNVRRLDTGWEMARVAPGVATTPADLVRASAGWQPAVVPGTVASVTGWETEEAARADEYDHWYRVTLPHANNSATVNGRVLLRFDGLATLAEVWLNEDRILTSDNMFLAHSCDVTHQLRDSSEHVLHIRFAALRPVLRQRRSRGRWPTRLVSEKHLRFVRTTLLGYMPGWYPPVPTVGPWRAVSLAAEAGISLHDVTLRPTLDGRAGVLNVDAVCRLPSGMRLDRAELRLGDSAGVALSISKATVEDVRVDGVLRVSDVVAWWPHTHGEPALHEVTLLLTSSGITTVHELGRVGFRSLVLDRESDGQGFGVRINGSGVFCRGACWSPLDVAAIHAEETRLRRTLMQAREAGFNMLRISGTMAYESDAFYALCDELGILIWQDFMFANFDYPVEAAGFVESCRMEAQQFLQRVGSRCSLAVLCGGSEVQQQGAMMGVPREHWSNVLFDEVLPGLCAEERVDAAYVPSSPSGGALPFHVNAGVGHYYGVGAYKRPLTDVRIADVRFASECLAFSNPPEPVTLERWLGTAARAALDPRYRKSVPRDPGASWDFADVSDHYVSTLFGVDARALRDHDPGGYLDLSRVAVGEAMSAVMTHLRRHDSQARGALVWMLRDPHRAAGWGLIDGDGVPKAAYYFLKRACAPRALWFSDEGVNGLLLHADNERDAPWQGRLEVSLYRADGLRVEHAHKDVEVPAASQRCWNVEALIGHFVDASYAYRFGPAGHRWVTASWRCAGADGPGMTCCHDIQPALPVPDEDVQVRPEMRADGVGELVVVCPRVSGHVAIDLPGASLADNYFRLVPGVAHRVQLTRRYGTSGLLVGSVRMVGGGRCGEFQVDA